MSIKLGKKKAKQNKNKTTKKMGKKNFSRPGVEPWTLDM